MGKPNAMVAAGKRLTGDDAVKAVRNTPGWAARAWDFYDTIGEFRYAADWVGAMLSKARLFIAAGGVEVQAGEDVAVDLLDALYGGRDGQPEMLRAYGTHLTVAGECYLVGATRDDIDEWQVVAASELSRRGGTYYISRQAVESDGEVFVMRLWRPHPRKHSEANAPSRAVLPILAEINGLTMHVAAQIDSRLTSAGVLLLPSELTFPTQPVTAGGQTQAQPAADQFVQALIEVAGKAREDQASAEARTPIVVTAPGEAIEHAKYMTFWTALDEQAIALRSEAIRRLALGLDMPPEVLTGSGDLNHWNAWSVDEAAIKVHAEPALELICSSLTQGYLWPLLRAEGVDEDVVQTYTIEADTSAIRLRPNRSEQALELYDRGELKASSVRRENGFDETDAPTPEQVVEFFVRKVASGSTTPELVAQALMMLGVPQVSAAVSEAVPTQAPDTPSLVDHPRQDPPPVPDALLAVAEQMVFRALERAGNRLKTKLNGTRPPGVAASELYLFVPCQPATMEFMLADAWEHVARFCPRLHVEPALMTQALDAYCRTLITEQRPHDPDLLGRYLATTAASC